MIAGFAMISVALSMAVAKTEKLSSKAMLASLDVDSLIHSDSKLKGFEIEDPKKDENPDIPSSNEGNPTREKEKITTMRIDEKMVMAEIKHQLASHFSITDDFRIRFDKQWKDQILPEGNWEIQITSFPPKGIKTRFFVTFELWNNGERVGTWQEAVRCELWVSVYVCSQYVERGQVLNPGQFDAQSVDILSLYQTPVEPGTKLTDYVAKNGLRNGEPLYWKDMKERPLVARHQIIEVVAEEGLMKITLKAKALEDGVKGQVIRVRNLQSFSDIQAEVIGVSRARVYF